MPAKDKRRFWSYVKKGDSCWEWQGGRFKKRGGYGQFHFGGRKNRKALKAHRVAWELYNGRLPHGVFVLHKCDNPPCVRPSHLFLGTAKDNAEDMTSKGRSHQAKLKPSDIPQIRLLLASRKFTQEEIGNRFGVGQDTISLIKLGRTWSHVF